MCTASDVVISFHFISRWINQIFIFNETSMQHHAKEIPIDAKIDFNLIYWESDAQYKID